MSATETRTINPSERGTNNGEPRSGTCGVDLPAVIQAIFDCTRNVTLLLARHVGREVYVLLLKRDRNVLDPRRAGRNAPDIVMWTLEATCDDGFVLRRPKASTVRA